MLYLSQGPFLSLSRYCCLTIANFPPSFHTRGVCHLSKTAEISAATPASFDHNNSSPDTVGTQGRRGRPLAASTSHLYPAVVKIKTPSTMTETDSSPDRANGLQEANGSSSSSSSTSERGSTSTPVLESYVFPEHRLKSVMEDPSKTPLLLVACGSFSPITYLHLRMFEMAADYAKFSTDFEVVGGFLSPVSDAYKKAGLASADHRYDDTPTGQRSESQELTNLR